MISIAHAPTPRESPPISTLDEHVEGLHPDIEFLRMDGYDDCVIGVVTRFGQQPILCYDRDAILQSLMGQGMSRDEAVEYFEHNQIGAWVGDATPCFLEKLPT